MHLLLWESVCKRMAEQWKWISSRIWWITFKKFFRLHNSSKIKLAFNVSSLQVNPSDVWLRDECDVSVYLREQNGYFKFEQLRPYSILTVEEFTISPGFNMNAGFSSTSGHSQQANTHMQGSFTPAPLCFDQSFPPRKSPLAVKCSRQEWCWHEKAKNQISKPLVRCTWIW